MSPFILSHAHTHTHAHARMHTHARTHAHQNTTEPTITHSNHYFFCSNAHSVSDLNPLCFLLLLFFCLILILISLNYSNYFNYFNLNPDLDSNSVYSNHFYSECKYNSNADSNLDSGFDTNLDLDVWVSL